MRSINHTLNGTPQRLSDLFPAYEQMRFVAIYNPTGNDDVYIGGGDPVFPIVAETDRIFPITNLKNVHIKGTNAQTCRIIIGS